jgi:hypothetical protein
MTTVIVKGATFESSEKNVPDHFPLTSVAACCVEPAADVGCMLRPSVRLGAHSESARITVVNNNEKSRTRKERFLLVILIFPLEQKNF